MAIHNRKTNSYSFDQIEEVGSRVPSQVDGLRGDSFDRLSTVSRARLVQSRRERARLEAKHGRQHPAVVEADRRMVTDHRLMVNARVERDRVNTTAAERREGEWLLHGYVRNRDGVAVEKATVALYPDDEGLETALLETRSDSKGYFQLVLPQEGRKPGLSTAEAIRDEAGGAVLATSGDTADTGDTGAADTGAADTGGREAGGGLRINTNVSGGGAGAAANNSRATRPQRLSSGMRINTAIRETFVRDPVFVGARPEGGELTMDSTPLYPAPSMIAYRDLVIDTRAGDTGSCQLRTRFLGNSGTRELHNLDNEKPGCQIAEMRPDHRVYFVNEAEAQRLDYDFCAYCYGRERSQR